MYVCMYVCMSVCMCAIRFKRHIYLYIHINENNKNNNSGLVLDRFKFVLDLINFRHEV